MPRPLLALLLLLAAPALADPALPPAWAPSALAAELTAIARIRPAERDTGGCTAVLVAPDRAFTAGHCARGDPERAGGLVLIFGPDRDPPLHVAPIARVVLHPDAADATVSARNAAGDLALLILSRPVPGSIVAPLPLTDPEPGLPHAVYGFVAGRDAPLSGHADCAVTDLGDGVYGSDCRVRSGLSGAPLLRRQDGGWAVAGLFVATVRQPMSTLRSLAVRIDPDDFPATD